MIIGAFCGGLAFVIFFCAQLVFIHSLSSTKWLVWNKRCVFATLIVLSASTELVQEATGSAWLTSGGWLLGALWADLTFLCLYVLYMPFYFVVMTSLSVETLIMLQERGGTLHVSKLQERFSSEAFVIDRFATMLRNGMLRQTPHGYVVTEKARQTTRPFVFIKSLWRLGAGG